MSKAKRMGVCAHRPARPDDEAGLFTSCGKALGWNVGCRCAAEVEAELEAAARVGESESDEGAA